MDNKDLENEIAKIKERNKRVELDKAWETCPQSESGCGVLRYLPSF